MANYLFNGKKKRVRLARLEQDLVRGIRDGSPPDRQLRLADEVRLARIRVLRAEQSNLNPTIKSYGDQMTAIDKHIASLETAEPKKILADFIARLDHVSV